MGLLRRFRRKPKLPDDPMDYSLLGWDGHPANIWKRRDSMAGTLVTGMTGSGKTMCVGAHIAQAMLRSGYGFCVTTVKGGVDEEGNHSADSDVGTWQRWAKAAGREHQLVIVEPGGEWTFNPLLYLLSLSDKTAHTHSLVAMLMQLVEVAERADTVGDQAFWSRSLEAKMRKAVDLAKLSTNNPFTLSTLYEIITQSPPDTEAIHAGSSWWETSACGRHLRQARERELRGELSEEQKSDFELCGTFFLDVWPQMSPRTRGVIDASFVNIADLLLSGIVKSLMDSPKPNLFPELAEQGAIIVLALPTNDYGAVGQLIQVAYKSIFEGAMLRRNIDRNPRPVCLWVDEAARFCSKETTTFVRESRSKNTCSVLLSQDYNAFLSAGMRREQVDSLLANLGTKCFMAQSCHVTNEYAAQTVGKALVNRINWHGPQGGEEGSGGNVGGGQAIDYEEGTTPRDFLTMRTGGPPDYVADALVVQPGKIFSNGKPYLRCSIPLMRS